MLSEIKCELIVSVLNISLNNSTFMVYLKAHVNGDKKLISEKIRLLSRVTRLSCYEAVLLFVCIVLITNSVIFNPIGLFSLGTPLYSPLDILVLSRLIPYVGNQ